LLASQFSATIGLAGAGWVRGKSRPRNLQTHLSNYSERKQTDLLCRSIVQAHAVPILFECDPNGIRTHFEDFAMLRNFATNMR